MFSIKKTDEEYDNEVAIYDNIYKKWIKKRVQGFYFPEKRNGHVMCTGRYNDDYGVYMFGGYGHARYYESKIKIIFYLDRKSFLFTSTYKRGIKFGYSVRLFVA